eukprot:jgi/Ulvmu1/8638/UM046_0043.1
MSSALPRSQPNTSNESKSTPPELEPPSGSAAAVTDTSKGSVPPSSARLSLEAQPTVRFSTRAGIRYAASRDRPIAAAGAVCEAADLELDQAIEPQGSDAEAAAPLLPQLQHVPQDAASNTAPEDAAPLLPQLQHLPQDAASNTAPEDAAPLLPQLQHVPQDAASNTAPALQQMQIPPSIPPQHAQHSTQQVCAGAAAARHGTRGSNGKWGRHQMRYAGDDCVDALGCCECCAMMPCPARYDPCACCAAHSRYDADGLPEIGGGGYSGGAGASCGGGSHDGFCGDCGGCHCADMHGGGHGSTDCCGDCGGMDGCGGDDAGWAVGMVIAAVVVAAVTACCCVHRMCCETDDDADKDNADRDDADVTDIGKTWRSEPLFEMRSGVMTRV